MRNTFSILVFILVLSSTKLFSQSAEEFYELAKKVYPNYEKAAYYLTKAVYKEPENANWYLARAKVNTFSDKMKDSEIERDLKKALSLAPADPYVNAWYLSSGLINNEADKNSVLIDLFEHAKKNPEILNYYVNAVSGFNKKFKFENSDEINALFKKSPKTFRNIICYWKFLMLEGKLKEAAAQIELLKSLSYADLSKDIIPKYELNIESVPLQIDRYSQYEIDDNSLHHDKHAALKVRLLDEEFITYEREKGRYFKTLRGNMPAPYVSIFHIEALLLLGRHSDALKFANSNDDASARRFMLKYKAEACSAMGMFKEAASALEERVKTDIYLSEDTFSLVKVLVKDQQFEKALNLAKLLKLKTIPHEDLSSMLQCSYYLTTKQFGAWNKNYEAIKKYHGSSNYHELMHQVNIVRTSCGNPHLNIYQKNKEKTPHNQIEMIFTQANSALFKKKNEEAQSLLKLAETLTPDDYRHTYMKALHLFKSGNAKAAFEKINTSLQQAALDADSIILKGMIQIELGDLKGAYQTFSSLPNQRTAAYYKVITLFCFGKFDTVLTACEKLVQTDCDIRIYPVFHMLKAAKDKEAADAVLKGNIQKFKTASTVTYAQYKLGTDDFKSYKKQLDYGPLLAPKFNFTIGFEAMQKGEKEKALEYFKKCLIPYSIDLPEYHMAKTCIKILEK